MKLCTVLLVVVCGTFAGCASTPERSAARKLASYSTPGASGEVVAGSYGYFSLTGRWPKEVADLLAGLREIDRMPDFVHTMRELVLTESDDGLAVTFVSRDGVRGDLKLKPPTQKRPNKAPEQAPTAGTSAAEQPLVPAAVVAHL
jgi:hypothetical protein